MGNLLAGSQTDLSLLSALLGHGTIPDRPFSIEEINFSIETLSQWMVPLKDQEPENIIEDLKRDLGFRFVGRMTCLLVDALRPLAVKTSGKIGSPPPRDIGVWLASMVAALGDIPPRIAVRAANDALHVPIRFPNEIESAIREVAKGVKIRYDLARTRLERMKRDAEKSSSREHEGRKFSPILSDEELQRMPEGLRKIGIGAGWLVEDCDGKLSWVNS